MNRVLIVDADAMWRQCLSWLIPSEFEIIAAKSGEEALSLLSDEVVLVITASELGGRMHGLEFLSSASMRCPDARFVFIPYFTTESYQLGCPRGTTIVTKQAREAEFAQAVSEALPRIRYQQVANG